MLAADCEGKIDYFESLIKRDGYVLASRKLDGIRATVRGGQLLSRSGKLIPNNHVRSVLETSSLEGLDGELVSGRPCGPGVMQRAMSAFMSQGGIPDFTWYVFDEVNFPGKPFEWRREEILNERKPALFSVCHVQVLHQHKITDLQALIELEETALDEEYEGLIVRSPVMPYKNNRSTLREGGMVKLKRFADSEATIIGFQELMHNANPHRTNELGYTTHTSHKAGQVPMDTLGALRVRDVQNPDWEFNIGTGFDQELRKRIWDNREAYMGALLTYKYLPVGMKDLPRHPVFKSFRAEQDL